MKRNRIIVLLFAVMLVSMQFNIVTLAEDIYFDIYENCYDNVYGKSDNVVVQHFIDKGLFFKRSDVDTDKGYYIKADTRNRVNTLINSIKNDYQYIYLAFGYNGGASFQLFCSNKPFYGFNGGIVVPDNTDEILSYYRYLGNGNNINYFGSSTSDYSDLSNWQSGIKSYYDMKTTTCGGKSYVVINAYSSCNYGLLYSTVPVYSTYEARALIDGESFTSDYNSSYGLASSNFLSKFDKFWGSLTNVNIFSQGYDSNDYYNSPMDISSEGSNNALMQFTMCGVADTKYYSNYGLALNYALSDMAYNTYSKGKLCVDYTITLRMLEQNQNNVLPVKTLKCSQKYDLRGQSGSVEVDLFGLISSNMLSSVSDVLQYGAILQALNGTSVDGVVITKSVEYLNDIKNNKYLKFFNLNNILQSTTYTYNDVVYTYVFDTFTVSAKAYVSNGNSSTNRRNASVDLVKGSNNSYNYTGVDVDNLTPDTSDVINNTNYFVNTDNGYRYYNSVTNEVKDCGDTPFVSLGDIVINVDVNGGGGSSGSMVQNNNVSFPESIWIKFQDMNNVTIDDDDLSYESLAEQLKEGFGLIDDDSTPQYGDGFIYMISEVYSGIDPNLKTIIMFGISTTIGIAVIRMIFKR